MFPSEPGRLLSLHDGQTIRLCIMLEHCRSFLGEQRGRITKQKRRLCANLQAALSICKDRAIAIRWRATGLVTHCTVTVDGAEEQSTTHAAHSVEDRLGTNPLPSEEPTRKLWRFINLEVRNLPLGPMLACFKKQGIVQAE